MTDRDDEIRAEALALWVALYGQPPAMLADGSQMMDIMLGCMPPPPYQPGKPIWDAN